jgi:hypothetical protein
VGIDPAVADDEPAIGEFHDRVQRMNGVRSKDPAQAGGAGQIHEVAPVTQSDRGRRCRHAIPEIDALLVHGGADHLGVGAMEFHVEVRIGHDGRCDPHVLVGLLAGVRRQLPRFAEEQRRAWRHARLLRSRCGSGSRLGGCNECRDNETDEGQSCAHVGPP